MRHQQQVNEESRQGKAVRQVRRQDQPRAKTVQFRVGDADHEEICAGAAREGLSRSAFIVKACLARARGDTTLADLVLRGLYEELKDTVRQVNMIGVNFNQVAKRVNATGRHSADIGAYAAFMFKAIRRLDEVVVAVWAHLK
jgi:uncharacterized protein (DUF1778 family)